MSMRVGSLQAKEFFENKEIITREWLGALNNYNSAIRLVSHDKCKNKDELILLDNYLHQELIQQVNSRNQKHLTLTELSKIMRWKLLKGKMRPLQKLVDGNNPQQVIDCTTKAFQILDENSNSWEKSIDILNQLRGIGEATSSAILSLFYPQICPFMADEVIDTTCPSRNYTRKEYRIVQATLSEKACSLNNISQKLKTEGKHVWKAEDVGKVIWIIAIMHRYNIDYRLSESTTTDVQQNTSNSKKRKSQEN